MSETNSIPADDGFDGSLPRSFLRPTLHVALLPGPSHGYDLLEQLRAFGLASVDLAGVYRALRAMEREKLVHSRWEPSELGPPRRVYQLNDRGAQTAENYLRSFEVARSYIAAIVSEASTHLDPAARIVNR